MTYGNNLIKTVNSIKSLPLEAVEDINMRDTDTDDMIKLFKKNLEAQRKSNPKNSMFQSCQKALLMTYYKDWIFVASVAIFTECIGIF